MTTTTRRIDPDDTFDEGTNPSNGWRCPGPDYDTRDREGWTPAQRRAAEQATTKAMGRQALKREINRNADGSRSDTTNRVWVVSDPTPDSTLVDICFDADPYRLALIMTGAGVNTVRDEHWTFYTNERSAKAEATRRLEAR